MGQKLGSLFKCQGDAPLSCAQILDFLIMALRANYAVSYFQISCQSIQPSEHTFWVSEVLARWLFSIICTKPCREIDRNQHCKSGFRTLKLWPSLSNIDLLLCLLMYTVIQTNEVGAEDEMSSFYKAWCYHTASIFRNWIKIEEISKGKKRLHHLRKGATAATANANSTINLKSSQTCCMVTGQAIWIQ